MPESPEKVQPAIAAITATTARAATSTRPDTGLRRGAASGRLTLRSRALTNATIGTERHRVVASLQFEDDGPGVPPELGETIFYPLVTARAGGTGLGLAVAQDIATRHGGIIEFDSRPGRTVFSLLLPMENGHDEAA